MIRILSLCLTTLALSAFLSVSALADDQNKDKDKASTHEGTVVSAKNGQLVMKGKSDKEHTHTLSADARILCDGKECKLTDLKTGQKVRVTTKKGDNTTAIKVEALDKNTSFDKKNN